MFADILSDRFPAVARACTFNAGESACVPVDVSNWLKGVGCFDDCELTFAAENDDQREKNRQAAPRVHPCCAAARFAGAQGGLLAVSLST